MSAERQRLLTAGVELLGRCGARELQIRYHDDQQPVLWMAAVQVTIGQRSGWEAAAALDPAQAVVRLCEAVVDGGECTHCHKPTAVDAALGDRMLADLMCWYAYDPELGTFRRSCEGVAP